MTTARTRLAGGGLRSLVGALVVAAAGVVPTAAWADPLVFWASEPALPNETVLLQGHDLEGATVELSRLPDGEPQDAVLPRTPPPPVSPLAPAAVAESVKEWAAAEVLQSSPQSLKFVVPPQDDPGVYVVRVKREGKTSRPFLLNAPQVWWLQGDRGPEASPGGWLRIFGTSLLLQPLKLRGVRPTVALYRADLPKPYLLGGAQSDCSLTLEIPAAVPPGTYSVLVGNGFGAAAGWREGGSITIERESWPSKVFSVLDHYGPDEPRKMRETLAKYRPAPDRTEGLQAALKKAKENGGGVVYFPAGKYSVSGEIKVPPKTTLRGEGMGLVVLWWGKGRFTLDGGDQLGLERDAAAPKPPSPLISGRDFWIEQMSLYLPLDHVVGIQCDSGLRMNDVRVRIDHHWDRDGSKRPEGTVARLGERFDVVDCDIEAKGTGLVPGRFGRIAHCKIAAGKVNVPLGGAREVIVEYNQFVSTYPTAYQNIAGVGRNLYYANNSHEALAVHQADYSFTFDAGGSAYWGKVSQVKDGVVTLASDPRYPDWAPEKHKIWKEAVVVVQEGRGAGQWRNVVGNKGREWRLDRPFDLDPDETSTITIVPMNGRALVVDNHFEDANWVNAGYGTAIDVVYRGNTLNRCAQLLNYGVPDKGDCQPNWYVQYFGNHLLEGHTSVDTGGAPRNGADYKGVITRCTVHRRHEFADDNSGEVAVFGVPQDVVIEGCTFNHPQSRIRIDGGGGVLLRNNDFGGPPRYEGKKLADALIADPPAESKPAEPKPADEAKPTVDAKPQAKPANE